MSTKSKGARIDRGEMVVITQSMYGWSKHGGARHGLVKENLDVWVCQICSQPQTRDMASYMISMDEDQREFIRVCSACKHEIVQSDMIIQTLEHFRILIKEVRKLRRRRVENLIRRIQ